MAVYVKFTEISVYPERSDEGTIHFKTNSVSFTANDYRLNVLAQTVVGPRPKFNVLKMNYDSDQITTNSRNSGKWPLGQGNSSADFAQKAIEKDSSVSSQRSPAGQVPNCPNCKYVSECTFSVDVFVVNGYDETNNMATTISEQIHVSFGWQIVLFGVHRSSYAFSRGRINHVW